MLSRPVNCNHLLCLTEDFDDATAFLLNVYPVYPVDPVKKSSPLRSSFWELRLGEQKNEAMSGFFNSPPSPCRCAVRRNGIRVVRGQGGAGGGTVFKAFSF